MQVSKDFIIAIFFTTHALLQIYTFYYVVLISC